MRVLLDVNTPRRVRGFLSGHEVITAQEQGWHTIENGELLRPAEAAGFDVMVTCDKNIGYQQNLRDRRIALVVISTNDWSVLQNAGEIIGDAVGQAEPNYYWEVDVAASRAHGERYPT